MRKLLLLPLLAVLTFPFAARAATVAENTGLYTTGSTALGPALTANSANTNIAAFIGYYIIQPILGIVGLIFFLMMLYAGVLWMTAGGNSEQVKKAKQIFINSIVGVVIITAAYALTTAVFNAVTTGDVSGSTL